MIILSTKISQSHGSKHQCEDLNCRDSVNISLSRWKDQVNGYCADPYWIPIVPKDLNSRL